MPQTDALVVPIVKAIYLITLFFQARPSTGRAFLFYTLTNLGLQTKRPFFSA